MRAVASTAAFFTATLFIAAFSMTLVALPAAAVDATIEMSAESAVGSLCSGVSSGTEFCSSLGLASADQITVRWSIDDSITLNGYDVVVSWDDEELTLVSCEAIAPDPGDPSLFVVSPCDTGAPAGSDALAVTIGPGFTSTQLFSMTFALTAVAVCDTDGLADVSWSANGAGLSPASVVLQNPSGASIDIGAPVRACNDGLDNDNDGSIDFDGGACAGLPAAEQTSPDPQCSSPTRNRETRSACGLGHELVVVLWGLAGLRRARRRSDHVGQ